MTAKKIALFIDADNISAKFGKQIFDALERRGEIFIRRIYGNWEKISLHGWNDCILSFSLRAVQQPDFATGKNATDMSLTIDAMDVLHDGKAEVFALVSNDSDFTPLAIRLREGGMTVIGLGNGQVSNSFRAACNEFIDLSAPVEVSSVQPPPEVVKKAPPAQAKPSAQMSLFVEDKAPAPSTTKVVPITSQAPVPVVKKDLQILHDIMREAASLRGDEKGFVPLCWAGQFLREKNFTVKDFGYGSLNKFVAAFPDMYEVIQRETGENFCYRCLEPADSDKINRLHDILHELATLNADESGFADLSRAGHFIAKQKLGFGVRSLGYGTLHKFVCAFPDLYEIRKEQKKIFYRCRANDRPSVSDNDRINRLHDILRETAATHSDDAGFSLLNYAGQAIKREKLGYGVKDFGYHQLRDFVTDFPDLYEIAQDNTGSNFRYRCRQVQKLP